MGNALSLEFVLNVDEVFFSAMVPRTVKFLIQNTAPLRICSRDNRSTDLWSMIRLSSLSIVVLIVVFLYILPQVQTMKDVQAEMCGCNTAFVYRQDMSHRW